MAPQLNTAADIAAFVNPIFDGALLIARDNNVMLPLVQFFGDRSGTALRQNSQYGGATINSIGETDDLASQAFTPASIAQLKPTEAGGQYMLTDLRVESDPFSVQSDASMDLGLATGTKMEVDMLGTFASFTGGTIGAAGTVITWGHVAAGIAQLRNQKAPMPYSLVLHPFTWHPLAKAILPGVALTNVPAATLDEFQRKFYVGTVTGCDIFITSNITGGGTNTSKGGLFARPAIGFDLRRAPRLEPQRDASRRGVELNMSTVYAAGVWRPLFGITMLFDCSTPTS
jgi:hypothetical protein